MIDQTTPAYQDGRDMVILRRGRWYLYRNLEAGGDDWVSWEVSVPDTGQGGEAALAEVWERGS